MNEFATHLIVPRDHPSFEGHFPGQPIVPGVVLLDLVFAAIQAAVPQQMKLESIVSTKFLRAVGPDARVDVQIKLVPDSDPNRLKARFVGSHADATVVEGSFLLAIESSGNAP